MKTFIYNSIGGIALALGILGAFLPLLPSTCFILLATWAFSKSSPTFHAWLYFNSPFSDSIQDWKRYRIIPTKIKWFATSSIVASYSLTVFFVENLYVLSGVGVGLLILIAYLLSKPSQAQQVTYQQIPELHQPIT